MQQQKKDDEDPKAEPMRAGERLLTEAQAAERLSRTKSTLQAWRHSGRGPKFVIDEHTGRFAGYREGAIDEYLIGNEVSSTAEGRLRAQRPLPPPPASGRKAKASRG
jgi:hypothetical protein